MENRAENIFVGPLVKSAHTWKMYENGSRTQFSNRCPGLRLAQTRGIKTGSSVLFPRAPEDGSRIQLSKRCNFTVL
jgi:hypothetical protein